MKRGRELATARCVPAQALQGVPDKFSIGKEQVKTFTIVGHDLRYS
jgi:hypothetical protein